MYDIVTNKNEQLNYKMHASFIAVFLAVATVLIIKCKFKASELISNTLDVTNIIFEADSLSQLKI